MTARLHNGPSQTNVIISDYVSLSVKYDGNPDVRCAFKGKFGPRGIFLCVKNVTAASQNG